MCLGRTLSINAHTTSRQGTVTSRLSRVAHWGADLPESPPVTGLFAWPPQVGPARTRTRPSHFLAIHGSSETPEGLVQGEASRETQAKTLLI